MNTDPEKFTPEAVHPLNATEQAVAALWCEALQIAELPGVSDNFFALGGDSMSMTMLEFRISEELSVELPTGALLNAPSLRELSALIDQTRSASRAATTSAEPNASRADEARVQDHRPAAEFGPNGDVDED